MSSTSTQTWCRPRALLQEARDHRAGLGRLQQLEVRLADGQERRAHLLGGDVVASPRPRSRAPRRPANASREAGTAIPRWSISSSMLHGAATPPSGLRPRRVNGSTSRARPGGPAMRSRLAAARRALAAPRRSSRSRSVSSNCRRRCDALLAAPGARLASARRPERLDRRQQLVDALVVGRDRLHDLRRRRVRRPPATASTRSPPPRARRPRGRPCSRRTRPRSP